MIDLKDELTQMYISECHEYLVTLDADLHVIQEWGSESDREVIDRAFRAVQSIKDGSGFSDLVNIPTLAHKMENVIQLIRTGQMSPTPGRIRTLLIAKDKLHEMILTLDTSDQADISDIVAPLAKLFAKHRTILTPKQGAIPPTEDQGYRHLRILVVEDDFASRHLLHAFLSRYGECHVASNGAEAVTQISSAQKSRQIYDLICMDIMMPEMDGQSALKEIRAMEKRAGTLSPNGMRIIMTTALANRENVVQSLDSLCDAYLVKPIDTGKLLAHMKRLHLV